MRLSFRSWVLQAPESDDARGCILTDLRMKAERNQLDQPKDDGALRDVARDLYPRNFQVLRAATELWNEYREAVRV